MSPLRLWKQCNRLVDWQLTTDPFSVFFSTLSTKWPNMIFNWVANGLQQSRSFDLFWVLPRKLVWTLSVQLLIKWAHQSFTIYGRAAAWITFVCDILPMHCQQISYNWWSDHFKVLTICTAAQSVDDLQTQLAVVSTDTVFSLRCFDTTVNRKEKYGNLLRA